MSDNWRLLDWENVCEQAPAIQRAHDKADCLSEYGRNFYEFINTAQGLNTLAQEWWDSLAPARKRELIADRICRLRDLLDLLEAAKE